MLTSYFSLFGIVTPWSVCHYFFIPVSARNFVLDVSQWLFLDKNTDDFLPSLSKLLLVLSSPKPPKMREFYRNILTS